MSCRPWYENALLVNRDACWYILLDERSKEAMEQSVRAYFYSFGQDRVTDVLFCVLEQTAVIPTEAFYFRGDKYLQTSENGVPVDYSGGTPGEITHLKGLYQCFREYGIDVPQIFVETMKELGIRPWITLRMNDAHFGMDKTSVLRSPMYYEAIRNGETIGDDYGIFTNCHNFRYPRYPTAVRNLIREVLEKYDVFGLELDFMRYIYCFDYKHDPRCHEAMTEFVREIRCVADEAGKKWGHPIRLLIRTCRDPKCAFDFGFDIEAMCRGGLIDGVVPTPEGIITDSAVPVKKWKALLGERIPVFAGVEARNVKMTVSKPEHIKAYTAAFYAGGTDGIYLNNHEYDRPAHHAARSITRENCTKGRREFTVTYQDTVAEGNPVYKPLPLSVAGQAQLPLEVGPILPGTQVSVVIDFEGDDAPLLSAGDMENLAGTAVEPVSGTAGGKTVVLTDHTPLCYALTGVTTENALNLTFTGAGVIHYVNVIIDGEE